MNKDGEKSLFQKITELMRDSGQARFRSVSEMDSAPDLQDFKTRSITLDDEAIRRTHKVAMELEEARQSAEGQKETLPSRKGTGNGPSWA